MSVRSESVNFVNASAKNINRRIKGTKSDNGYWRLKIYYQFFEISFPSRQQSSKLGAKWINQ